MDWWWTLLKAMDDHEGQAAWAQGFFSVLAIVAAIMIDRRSAGRLASDAQERAREAVRQQAEITLGVWMQAGQILAYSENVEVAIHRETGPGSANIRYRHWREHVTDQLDLFRTVLERVSDPMLFLYGANFIQAARPSTEEVVGSTPEPFTRAVSDRVASMREAKKGLTEKANAASKAAGFTGHEYLVVEVPK